MCATGPIEVFLFRVLGLAIDACLGLFLELVQVGVPDNFDFEPFFLFDRVLIMAIQLHQAVSQGQSLRLQLFN